MISLYHKSNPVNRDSILNNGLLPRIGESYESHYCEKVMGKVVFVTTENNYDSTYDDDVFLVSITEKEYIDMDFKVDREVINGLYTYSEIQSRCLTLIYKGTGESCW